MMEMTIRLQKIEVPGDVLGMLEENGLRIVTQLTKWPKDFTQVIVITFK
jgi:hypothetical protein